MASTLNNFSSEKQLTSSADSLASSTESEKIFIGKVTFTNTSSSSVEVTVWRIATSTTPASGSGGNWLDKKSVQAGKVWECDKLESHVLGNSMSIYASADTDNVINADVSGVTES